MQIAGSTASHLHLNAPVVHSSTLSPSFSPLALSSLLRSSCLSSLPLSLSVSLALSACVDYSVRVVDVDVAAASTSGWKGEE